MKTTKLTQALVLVTLACGISAIGCELIVDFDRTRIPVDAVADATVPDGSVEASTFAPSPDSGGSSNPDSGSPGSPDADAGIQDAGSDG